MPEELSLVHLTRAKREIAEAKTIPEVKDIRDKADAIRHYAAKKRLSIDIYNDIVDIQLTAERRMGELLAQMPSKGSHGGDRKSSSVEELDSLEEMGLTKKESFGAQKLARVSDADFEAAKAQVRGRGDRLSSAAILEARRSQEPSDDPPLPTNKYRVIYADPPWKYGNEQPAEYGEQGDHYQLKTVDAIAEMGIRAIAADDAVLFLWVTSPILEESFRVVSAWGFKYKAAFVWDKVKHVMGHYNSVRHELLLVCVRGSCQPDVKKLFDSVYSEERTEHSKKPEFFREVIDTIYPTGKRIELFAREKHKGWDVYGNQV